MEGPVTESTIVTGRAPNIPSTLWRRAGPGRQALSRRLRIRPRRGGLTCRREARCILRSIGMIGTLKTVHLRFRTAFWHVRFVRRRCCQFRGWLVSRAGFRLRRVPLRYRGWPFGRLLFLRALAFRGRAHGLELQTDALPPGSFLSLLLFHPALDGQFTAFTHQPLLHLDLGFAWQGGWCHLGWRWSVIGCRKALAWRGPRLPCGRATRSSGMRRHARRREGSRPRAGRHTRRVHHPIYWRWRHIAVLPGTASQAATTATYVGRCATPAIRWGIMAAIPMGLEGCRRLCRALRVMVRLALE